ncbi:MAG TPA: hypothetical protein VHM90_02150 [Phycisphaerae bacterium]|nr:hypothetical protein [Phycisphaerae bacterium]
MGHRRIITLAFALAMLAPRVGFAQAEGRLPPVAPTGREEGSGGWMSQFVRDDVVTCMRDIDLVYRGDRVMAGSPRPERITSAVVEFRTPDNKRRVASITPPRNLTDSLFSTIGSHSFSWKELEDAPSSPSGQYLVAWIVNGQRRSNVVGVTLDARKDPAKLPLVRIVQLEPEKVGDAPGDVVVYVTRGKESDPAPDNMTLSTARLMVDGAPLTRKGVFFYMGPNGRMLAGGTLSYPINYASFEETVDFSKPHVLSALVGDGPFDMNKSFSGPLNGVFYPAVPQKLETGTPLADAWDKATAALAAAPVARVSLTGTIPDDSPVKYSRDGQSETRTFEITLTGREGEWRDLSLFNEFDFRNIPAGTYKVVCRPREQRFPEITVEGVKIDEKAAAPELTLPFKNDFEFTGKVSHADGTPAEKVQVSGCWVSEDGATTCRSAADTDAEGKFAMKSPFARPQYVAYMDGEKEVRIVGIKSGSANNLNFKLSK